MLRLLPLLLLAITAPAETISYNQQVRPILSDKCFLCHGPDVANNKAGLRLDQPSSAYAALKESNGHAIAPGDLQLSVAWQRILSPDESQVMPPPESNLSLTDGEKEILRRWIEQGAVYEEHWAFQALPSEVPVPTPEDAGWPQTPIDSFVIHRLESEDLTPSSPASPHRWLRRVTYDLTGLPPKPDDIEAFLTLDEQDQPKAREQAIERLLHSSAYGEHMATGWLDAARYADSYGYQSDQLNHQWPYRDWVVRAFNQNLPYDSFARWQIAGDLLENSTRDQEMATAFNRLHRLTNEGGSIREEWLSENAADRVHTFGTTFLALTMECARCHDHKYDPISARDYYALSAFFNSIDENGLYDHSSKIPSPSMLLPTRGQEAKLTNSRKATHSAEVALTQERQASLPRFEEWLKTHSPPTTSSDLEAGYEFGIGEKPKLINHAPGGLQNAKLGGATFARENNNSYLQLDGDHGPQFPDHLLIDRWTPFTLSLRLKDTIASSDPVVVAQRCFGTDVGYNGFDLMLEGGLLSARLYRVWPGNAIGVRSTVPIAANQWSEVSVTYDGSSRAEGLRIYIDGRPVPLETLRDRLEKQVMIRTYGSGHLTLGQRFRDKGFRGGQISRMKIHRRELSSFEIRHHHRNIPITDALTQPDIARAELLAYYQSAIDEKCRSKADALMNARKNEVMVEQSIRDLPVMRELPEPRETHLLARGEYDAPTDESTLVKRSTPSALPALEPRNATADRLDLANWLTSPDHPLTARVIVNRIWANFFGQGLVGTLDNFGLQGGVPSHPNLLDWLARDFIEHGWDIHHLCRQILLSSTYAQNSVATAELRELDPDNRLLARGPAMRLSSEQIRDTALSASGLMDSTMEGPPVAPYQPGNDLWRESNGMSPPYRQSTGKALHRRSIYSVWKRTAPLPNMTAFDSPTRETCSVTRSRTNTPLQALVLLNDVQFVEAARALAEAVHHKDPEEEIRTAFLRLAGRPPSTEEAKILMNLRRTEAAHFAAHPDDAASLIAHGDSAPRQDLDPVHVAATTSVCLAILNLDATIWKR